MGKYSYQKILSRNLDIIKLLMLKFNEIVAKKLEVLTSRSAIQHSFELVPPHSQLGNIFCEIRFSLDEVILECGLQYKYMYEQFDQC